MNEEYLNEVMPSDIVHLIGLLSVAENRYQKKKRRVELLKYELLLNTNWAETLGNKKPTIAEKEAYILSHKKILQFQEEEICMKITRDFYKRLFDAVMAGQLMLEEELEEYNEGALNSQDEKITELKKRIKELERKYTNLGIAITKAVDDLHRKEEVYLDGFNICSRITEYERELNNE